MRRLHFLLAVLLALPLSGCWKEQQQASAACNAVIKFSTRFPPMATVSTPLTRCLNAHGYVLDHDAPYCANISFPRRSPYCYAPDNFWGRLGHRLEMLYWGGPSPATE